MIWMIWHLQRERRRRYNARMEENGREPQRGLFGVENGVVGYLVIALAIVAAVCLMLG